MLLFIAAILGVFSATITSLQFGNSFTELVSQAAIGGFFLLVGLELRREAVNNSFDRSKLKVIVVATICGMLLPALIFLALVPSGARQGWVAVVATDIPITLAVATLGRFRPHVRAVLMTIAVLDDLGSVLVLATTGARPNLLYLIASVMVVVGFAIVSRKIDVSVFYVIGVAAIVVLLMSKAGLHSSLGAFAVGFAVPANRQVAQRVERRLQPIVGHFLLPIYIFLHSQVQLEMPKNVSASIITVVIVAKVVGKLVGIGGVLALARKTIDFSLSEAIATGLAGGAALTVALIGIDATLAGTPYATVVSLGILCATTIAVVLGIIAGRLTRTSISD